MGVANLWQVLQTTCRFVGLNDLKNKTIAIDLSIWICENSNTKFCTKNLKPYLRNLFFRTKALLDIGCKLIFVREGEVIQIKQDVMRKRNKARFGDYQTQSSNDDKKIIKRTKFDSVADECCLLLKYMGVKVIRSPCGEAEKACSYLNLIGRCDAVITNDSDAFLYGARVVYRNFNLNKKENESIEEYAMSRIEKELKYTREMLIALGLLLGCDYDQKGINGVGKENACKFLDEFIDRQCPIQILDLLRNWTKDDFKEDLKNKYENRIRRLVLEATVKFPNEDIINEYLDFPKTTRVLLSSSKYLSIEKGRPNLQSLQIYNKTIQDWPYEYSAEKVVPLIVGYESTSLDESDRILKPKSIIKTKRSGSVEYYQVTWHKMDSSFDCDLSDLTEYTTVEEKEKFAQNYPDLVDKFNLEIEAKKTSRKNKKTKIVILEKGSDDEENKENNYTLDSLFESIESCDKPKKIKMPGSARKPVKPKTRENVKINDNDDDDVVCIVEDSPNKVDSLTNGLSNLALNSASNSTEDYLSSLPFSLRMKKLYNKASIFDK